MEKRAKSAKRLLLRRRNVSKWDLSIHRNRIPEIHIGKNCGWIVNKRKKNRINTKEQIILQNVDKFIHKKKRKNTETPIFPKERK